MFGNNYQKKLKRAGVKSVRLRRSMDRLRKVNSKFGNKIL